MLDIMLAHTDRSTLLSIARTTIAAAVNYQPWPPVDPAALSPPLRDPRSSFVTLTENAVLRGCIGGLEPSLPLALDVQEHAAGAAMQDPRFPPMTPEELPLVRIEISVLTTPEPVEYKSPENLLALLRPHTDGVLLRLGYQRATFLPQVWEKVPDPQQFLEMLSEKMGAARDAWRSPAVQVLRYQVEMFEEPEAGN